MNDEQAREDWEKLVSKAVRNQDLYNAKLEVELRQILYADHRIKALEYQAMNDRIIMDHQGAQMQRLSTELEAKNQELKGALQKIVAWDQHDFHLAVNQGSNGVRDFYRSIAKEALKDEKP